MKIGYTILAGLWTMMLLSNMAIAQNRTPEEQRELFGYCDKLAIMKQFGIAEDIANKIGDIDLWATKELISVENNTNEVYATKGELNTEVIKRYKALKLSDQQLKSLADFKKNRDEHPTPCEAITLTYNKAYDTLSLARALQLMKPKYRKSLMDKLGINGRQADMIFETEYYKQKEALSISAMPETDFNKIRKTVAMYQVRENRHKASGLTEDQITMAISFFKENQLYPEQVVNK
ncbi:MAG: hypothetical protein B7Y15_11180 [Bacteroidetes bacterium 24-39-8]|jgi:hypothetical protein|nr:MAG: hypothetical protein B7Y15_11180 [Bacteroidetes bacterium 24-39-8]OZA63939.1 MAG: hypothetical protein B7X72_09580 [Sphingobacteriia bacterium 39-39-8]HQR93558.1 hypothetical protein [Sediminibacterium sp.]HQS56035.1 hypothetical protein [Sediminibacterium sp.]